MTDVAREFKELFFKNYELEKKKQNERKIIMQKEVPSKTVSRIINKYSSIVSTELTSLYKLYLTQNYKLDRSCFKGSSLRYSSLAAYRTKIKSYTNSVMPFNKSKTDLAIYKFIQEIKAVQAPIEYYSELEKGKSYILLSDLYKTNKISEAQISFLKSEINDRKAVSHNVKKEQQIKLEKSHNKSGMIQVVGTQNTLENMLSKKHSRNKFGYTRNETATINEIIVKNYKSPLSDILELITDKIDKPINGKTVAKKVSTCRGLAMGKEYTSSAYDALKRAYKKFGDKSTQVEVHEYKQPNNTKDKYVIISNNKVIKQHDSLDFIKGYLEAISIKDAKLYIKTELNC